MQPHPGDGTRFTVAVNYALAVSLGLNLTGIGRIKSIAIHAMQKSPATHDHTNTTPMHVAPGNVKSKKLSHNYYQLLYGRTEFRGGGGSECAAMRKRDKRGLPGGRDSAGLVGASGPRRSPPRGTSTARAPSPPAGATEPP